MRRIVKKIMKNIAIILVMPLYIILCLSDSIKKSDYVFQACSQFLSLFPGIPGNYLRQQFYCLSLAECYDDCCIEFGTRLNQRGIELGHRVYIGTNCCIGLCRLEDDVMLGSNVDLLSGKNQHFFDNICMPIREQGGVLEKIIVGQDCWLGNSSVVMANVGQKTIVAAGSVVVKNMPSYSIVGGNPAKVLRSRL